MARLDANGITIHGVVTFAIVLFAQIAEYLFGLPSWISTAFGVLTAMFFTYREFVMEGRRGWLNPSLEHMNLNKWCEAGITWVVALIMAWVWG